MIHVLTLFDSDGDNTAQACKASGGKLVYVHVVNPNTTQAFIQFFDAAAADVTVGTTTPKVTYLVSAGDGVNSGGFEQDFGENGPDFEKAITYACTNTATGNGDPTTGLTVNLHYK